ncbi:MAG: hypothetical protein JNM70_10240 [Anaerolineae bacterium]|nr:hypothetical protein [Anaerolineae bacterium]
MNPVTVAMHFEGKPAELKAAYDRLIAALNEFGPIREVPKQTSIHLEKNSGFAGIHPRKSHFNLEFRTNIKIEPPRIQRELQVSSRRFEYTVKIAALGDIDAELIGWLREAYDFSR